MCTAMVIGLTRKKSSFFFEKHFLKSVATYGKMGNFRGVANFRYLHALLSTTEIFRHTIA